MTADPVELVYLCQKCRRCYRFEIYNNMMRSNKFVCDCGEMWFDVYFEEYA